MEIQYFGGNCIRITTKNSAVVVDDNLQELGAKSVTKKDDIALVTSPEIEVDQAATITLDSAGEYEIAGVSVRGVGARLHLDAEGERGVIYKITTEDLRITIVGHIFAEFSEEQLEQIGQTDILIVPVGNSGYTLDGQGALKVIKELEPKIIIPTHYADKGLKYPVAQSELAAALKDMSMEPAESVEKLKIKPADLPELTKLIILERQ